MKLPKTNKGLERILPYLMIIFGVIGFIMAFVIMYEKLHILENPNYKPGCSINPVISCGSIMQSDQSNAFGFPNPIIGLASFPVVITVGLAMLAGARFKRWFWLLVQAGVTFAVGFITWLFYQSLYNIGALCPYCIVVWSVTIPLFWYTTLYNLRQKHLPVPARLNKASVFIQRHHGDILILVYLALIAAILNRFWYYWQTLI